MATQNAMTAETMELVKRLKDELREAEEARDQAQRDRNKIRKELAKIEEKCFQAEMRVDSVKTMIINALERRGA